MDIFTHMFISYMLVLFPGLALGGISEPQLLFGVICGVFPDFDILTFPLWKRFRGLRHHGITHSIAFGVLCPVVLGFIAQLLFGVPALALIPWGILTCVGHVLSDLVTSFAVPLLAPASWKQYTLNLDTPVNFYVVPFSLAGIFIFWQLRAVSYPFDTFLLFFIVIAVMMIVYYSTRAAIKVSIQRKHASEGDKVTAHPTSNILRWYLSITNKFEGTNIEQTSLYHLRKGRGDILFYEVMGAWPDGKPEPPVDTPEKAIIASAAVAGPAMEKKASEKAIRRPRWIELSAVVTRKGDSWEVFWFDWFSSFFRETEGLLFTITRTGETEYKRAKREIRW